MKFLSLKLMSILLLVSVFSLSRAQPASARTVHPQYGDPMSDTSYAPAESNTSCVTVYNYYWTTSCINTPGSWTNLTYYFSGCPVVCISTQTQLDVDGGLGGPVPIDIYKVMAQSEAQVNCSGGPWAVISGTKVSATHVFNGNPNNVIRTGTSGVGQVTDSCYHNYRTVTQYAFEVYSFDGGWDRFLTMCASDNNPGVWCANSNWQ